jgi:hypothetical protein
MRNTRYASRISEFFSYNNNNNNNNNLFHVLIDPDTGIDTIQGYRMSHKLKTLVSIVIN